MKRIKQKSVKWWAGVIACMILFGVIGAFSYIKTRPLIHGVNIIATITHTNSDSSMIEVRGKAQNAVHLKLDGREISIAQDGTFDEKVALLPGLGVLTINAVDKFGNPKTKKLEFVYTATNGSFAYNELPITKY